LEEEEEEEALSLSRANIGVLERERDGLILVHDAHRMYVQYMKQMDLLSVGRHHHFSIVFTTLLHRVGAWRIGHHRTTFPTRGGAH
jgi:hypothetical protein